MLEHVNRLVSALHWRRKAKLEASVGVGGGVSAAQRQPRTRERAVRPEQLPRDSHGQYLPQVDEARAALGNFDLGEDRRGRGHRQRVAGEVSVLEDTQ